MLLPLKFIQPLWGTFLTWIYIFYIVLCFEQSLKFNTLFISQNNWFNRAMAISISSIFGRLGTVAGANVVAIMMDDHCEIVFYLSGITLMGNWKYYSESKNVFRIVMELAIFKVYYLYFRSNAIPQFHCDFNPQNVFLLFWWHRGIAKLLWQNRLTIQNLLQNCSESEYF